ncbi:B3 domain-containing protein [Sesamum alatum]|uniref:B3 domain-containing protein n=1 Tax=Sesamum alatum TaxID=300844 RepID=A0AAE1XLL5_9LAMI|nr:B3 domain-containing protein [Sesamum alatum]
MARRRVARDERPRRINRESSSEKEIEKEIDPSMVSARFFKIMFGKDYSKVLYLPPKFARTVEHLAGQEFQIEDSSGLRWSVTLSYLNGSWAFQKGWPKFFLDHGLEEGQILIFNYVNGSHFVVQVYERTACERINFDNETDRPNKRSRRGTETVSEDATVPTTDLNSRDKPGSAASVASGSEFQTHQTHKLGAKFDSGRLQVLPIPINMEDPTCMINRDDGYYQGEDRNFLYESLFEMERKADDWNNFHNALDTKTILSHPEVTENANTFEKTLGTMNAPSEIPEETNIERDDTQMAVIQTNEDNGHSADIPTEKFEEAPDPKIALSHIDTVDQSKTEGDNSKMAVAPTNQVDGHSGEISTDKLEKALDTKLALCHTEITERTKIKGDDTQMGEVQAEQIDARTGDIFTDKCHSKPSDSSNLKKDMSGDASNFQKGNSRLLASDSESPSVCSNKIAGREVIRRCNGSSGSSSVLKGQFGKHAIKKELVELGEEANGLPEIFRTEEPDMVREYTKMSPLGVKVEPEQSYDIGRLVTVCAFSTEVKSLSHLELPIPFPSVPGRRDNNGRGKVVFLRDSSERLWPVLHPESPPVKSLTGNWRKFCEYNEIKLGDNCMFQVEDIMHRVYKVDVIP